MTTKKPRLPKSMRKTEMAVSREREVMRAVSDLEISIGMAFKLFRNRVANIFVPGSVADAAAVASPPDPDSTEIDPRFFESTLARDAPPGRGRRRGKSTGANGSSVVDALYQATAPVAANVDTRTFEPLGAYAKLILSVLVRFGRPCSTTFVALVLGRSESGSFDTAVAELRRHRYVDGDRSALRVIRAPEPGLGLDLSPLPTGRALLDMWVAKLEYCPGAILQTLYAAYPRTMDVDDVAATSKNKHGEPYSVSGSFDTYVAKLRKLELIEGKSHALSLHPVFAQAVGR